MPYRVGRWGRQLAVGLFFRHQRRQEAARRIYCVRLSISPSVDYRAKPISPH